MSNTCVDCGKDVGDRVKIDKLCEECADRVYEELDLEELNREPEEEDEKEAKPFPYCAMM
jgi:hypothetical protein